MMDYIITEKHNTAKRIANILSGGSAKAKKIAGVDTYEFNGKTVIGLSGHVVGVDFPEKYSRWSHNTTENLIDSKLVQIPTQKKFINALKKISKDAEIVTIATDFDREGEFIGLEALRIIREENPDIKVNRVRYSSITKAEIEKSFSSPTDIDYNLASASEARQIIDLIWGSVLTRYVSLSSGRLGRSFLSVGRVQSPTLSLLVHREKEIQAFIPKPYWEIYADLKNKEVFTVKHEGGQFWDKKEADEILSKLNGDATVTDISKRTKKEKPPTPFNTTEFIRAASSIGYTPANAMRIAEYLYTNGFISYPRTDNTVYPIGIGFKETISMFLKSEFKEYASALLEKGKDLIPTKGKKETTDHPPIYPVTVAKRGDLNEDQWTIYELVVRRFFSTFADNVIWETIKILVDINGENFKATGSRMIEQGWRWFYPYSKIKDFILPDVKVGEKLTVEKVEMAEKETQPPSRYGQGRLIKVMEDLGLGTKSTRHEIISKLYSRAYVQGNPLKPTNKAFAVVDSLESHADLITKPDMTALLEEDMDEITQGKISEEDAIKESKEILKSIYNELKVHRDAISKSLKDGLRADDIIGKCPDCGSDLLVRRSRRGSRFIGCSGYPNCTFTLPLPKNGQLIIKSDICEEHGLNHVTLYSGKGRPFDIGCPHCNFIKWQESKDKEKNDESNEISDELTSIRGIGEKTAEKLKDAGLLSVKDLIQADSKILAEQTRINENKIKGWQKIASGAKVAN